MKVKELIEKLQQMDPDLTVCLDDHGWLSLAGEVSEDTVGTYQYNQREHTLKVTDRIAVIF